MGKRRSFTQQCICRGKRPSFAHTNPLILVSIPRFLGMGNLFGPFSVTSDWPEWPKWPFWPLKCNLGSEHVRDFRGVARKFYHKWQFGHSGQSEVSGNDPNGFPMPKNLGIDTKIKSVACSEPKLQFWPIQTWPKFPKWPFWPLSSIWGVWKWSQSISHAQILWLRHQNQVCSPIGPIPPLTPHIGPLWEAITKMAASRKGKGSEKILLVTPRLPT